MIKLTEENTVKASQRSRKLKPFVKYVAERIFDVKSSRNTSTYRVQLFLIKGEKFGQCTCQASEKGLVCYHITSAVAVNFYRQNLKTEKRIYSVEEMNNAPIINIASRQPIERRGNTKI